MFPLAVFSIRNVNLRSLKGNGNAADVSVWHQEEVGTRPHLQANFCLKRRSFAWCLIMPLLVVNGTATRGVLLTVLYTLFPLEILPLVKLVVIRTLGVPVFES